MKSLYEKFFKRVLDITLSGMALFFLSPIFVIVFLLVRLNLGSPVIFKQKRPGKDEKIFSMYKFRTMTSECDENGNLLPDEIRLTRFGKFLRSTSLDELPELWNILKGDMSIVGPRPLLISYLEYYSSFEKRRHIVKPGLTGLAQINGRNSISWEDKFKFDIKYVENITFLGDVKIILKTVLKTVKRSDIHVGSDFKIGSFIEQRAYQKKNMEFSMKAKFKNIILRDIQFVDLDLKVKWINDNLNNSYLHYNIPLNIKDTINWYQNKDNSSRLDLIIEYDGVPIGLIGLININTTDLKAEFYITLGEHSYKRKGISYDAIKMLLDYSFKEMNLNKIYLNVDDENFPAKALYEKIGFEEEGFFKQDMLFKGKLIDRKRYAILRERYLGERND